MVHLFSIWSKYKIIEKLRKIKDFGISQAICRYHALHRTTQLSTYGKCAIMMPSLLLITPQSPHISVIKNDS